MIITVESAIELDATTRKEVEAVLAKHKQKGEIQYRVDLHILGGLRVYLGSKRIDLSLKGRLAAIEQAVA